MMYDATTLNLNFEKRSEGNWFMNRFGDTVGVYDGETVTIYDCGVCDGENTVYAGGNGRDINICVDNTGLLLGVPEHGYINLDGSPRHNPTMVSRTLFDKWKWGWQPGSDTMSSYWPNLLEPKHRPIAKTKGDVAITHSYCVFGYALINDDDYPVGTIEEDEQGRFVVLDKKCLFLLEDTQLRNRARLKK